MSNTSIAAPAICLFFNTLIKACSSTIGPRDALISQAVGSDAPPAVPRQVPVSKPITIRAASGTAVVRAAVVGS